MNNLAMTYSALGRHEDALELFQRGLEFSRRVLPENHPDIGEGRELCCFFILLISVFPVFFYHVT